MPRQNIIIAILALTLTTLACTLFVGGPDYPASAIPISEEEVTGLEQQIQNAVDQSLQTGTITMTINEIQLTSLLASRLQAESDPFFTEPQVYLQNGEIQIFGKARQGNFEANIGIVITTSIDAAGNPALTVKSVDFGPLPVPEGINSAIGSLVSEAFTGALGPAATGFRLESIIIADGLMTLSGRVK